MKPVLRMTVFYEPEEGRRTKVGRLARKEREILFEYDPEFVAGGIELSPFKLRLQPGVTVGDPALWDGLMGLFEDSLPDGWGRLLMDRRAAAAGLSASAMGPLDRLALVGARALGALAYEPETELEPPSVVSLSEIAADVKQVLAGGDGPDLDRLLALGGSPQGARPKVLVQVGDDGTLVHGERATRPGFVPYMVKFRAREDDTHAGTLEHAYMRMAAAAGIDVPATRLLGHTRRHPGYLAIQRFDRDGRRRIHMHTLAGLLHVPHLYGAITYRDLLMATRQLTRDETAVAEMFRRACFNVLAHNRDDHARNFAFLMDEQGNWRPSPAYDLTFSLGPGGEHSLLVGRDGRNPGRADLLELAASVDLRRPARIFDEVRAAVDRFTDLAERAGVPSKVRSRVAAAIGATPAPRSSRPRTRKTGRQR